ncbi:cytochrome C [Geomonas nitrogeniifigens]|uniref:Cytochrome C n=1 Tax=Geomonas diazotrophica TaxID=2843197 RepID=A0ABX8JH23_9BACT|nr:cytochrome c3 family protein [Geomonas nitrogeniifigens]QWV96436.1 cytochrome C [Geomonas nitrogeniifigens]QXE85500.1 cytochrome C [Geomonas nitrogeniifigens]
MLKRVLSVLVCLLTAGGLYAWAATTWQLQTKLSTTGGTLKVRNNATQTTAGSVVYTNFTTSANVPVTVSANVGYKISALTKSGTAVPLGNYTTQYATTFNKANGTTQSLVAGFIARQYQVTASAIGPGSISATSVLVSYNNSAVLTATPTYTNCYLMGVTGGTVADIYGSPVSYPYGGAVKITVANVIAPRTVTATFMQAAVNAGVDQVAQTNQVVNLTGTLTGSGTLAWSFVSGPATVDTSAWNTLTPSFIPVVPGTYVLQLAEMAGAKTLASDTVQITVTNSVTGYMRTNCNGCHSSHGVYPSTAFSLWSTGSHRTAGIHCITCHTNSAMPTPVNTNTVNGSTFTIAYASAGTVGSNFCATCHPTSIVTAFSGSPHNANGLTCSTCHTGGGHRPDVADSVCNGCHRDSTGNVANHPFAIGANPCIACHNPHSTAGSAAGATPVHFNTMTAAGYPASYVTSRSNCSNCHADSSSNLAVRQQWARSAHAAVADAPWKGEDFKTKAGCVQCHTTTGFVAWSSAKITAAWGSAADKTKEVLSCVGCHSDISNGILRSVTPVRPYAEDPGYQYPNLGKSNICLGCHSGTNNGQSIAVRRDNFADFGNLKFIDPHFMAVGGTSYAKGGYHFPGRSYSGESTHTRLGLSDANGPCVACHKNAGNGHTFVTGALPVCAGCHGSSLSEAGLAAERAAFLNGLEILKAQLAAKGFGTTSPTAGFSTTNWGSGENGANTMGAAFNYVLLASEPGAYAHNPMYAQQLLLDSLDYLDNAQLDNSVATLAIPNLVASGAISQAMADSFASYQVKDSCTTCHGGSAASAKPMATGGHSAHVTLAYGPGNYFGNGVTACQNCHSFDPATHLNGSVDLVNGAGSACVGCHPGGLPSWSVGRLSCTSCHAAQPSVLPNGVAAPYQANFDSTGHGRYASSSRCTDCHDQNSRHISGALGSYTRLSVSGNALCASCHNDAALVRPAFLNMSSHFTAKGSGQTMGCVACHDTHGSANRSMIRSMINGVAITFTNSTTGLVDLGTNLGLCQVCHTVTAHFRNGVPETGHPTTGCLNCHRHNAAGGAFKPFGTCDACHGYPPVPKRAGLRFGTMNNWSGARFESYSGGGGAHLSHVAKTAKASEGWNNCTPCHSGGAASHLMVLPINDHQSNVTVAVDTQYSFTAGSVPLYDSGKSCSNVSCHAVKAGSFSYYSYNAGSDDYDLITVNYGGAQRTPAWNATGQQCAACHGNPPADGRVWHSGNHGNQGPTSSLNQCQLCHPDVSSVNGQGTTITNPTQHRNGTLNVQGAFKSTCFGCH